MGTARWADVRSLEKIREKLNRPTAWTPTRTSFRPSLFLENKIFCQPPGSGSPEIYGQLPRVGLSPHSRPWHFRPPSRPRQPPGARALKSPRKGSEWIQLGRGRWW